MEKIQKITPSLWFDHNAEEAVNFYISIFKDSQINQITRFGKEGFEIHGMEEGVVWTIDFQIEDQHFLAFNGGPRFKFNEAISFIVHCDSQKEIDYYWDRLSAGGDSEAQQCGWLKDKYGVSWQIVPDQMVKLIGDQNPQKSQRVMKVLLQMKKLDIFALQRAFDQDE